MLHPPAVNTLFYGDNLHIMREFVANETVDLVYLDPLFNSNATCKVLFKAPTGKGRRRRSRPSRTPGTGMRRRSAPSTRF